LTVAPGTSKPALMVALEKHLIAVRARGEHAVLMMDEAQNLSMDLLEEIRLLSNLENRGDKLLQIFLVGQPELEAHLARHELRQLRQRITVHYRLNPLSSDETLGYIHHHINVAGGSGAIVFPTDTCREIYRLTHGIPREINTLASSALIAAYADNASSVSAEHVAAVAREGDFKSVLAGTATRPAEPAPVARPVVAAPAPPTPVAAPAPPPAAPAPRPQVVQQQPILPWPTMPAVAPEPVAQAPAAEPEAPASPYAAPSPAAPVSPYAPPTPPAPAPVSPYAPPPAPVSPFTPGVEPVSPYAPPAEPLSPYAPPPAADAPRVPQLAPITPINPTVPPPTVAIPQVPAASPYAPAASATPSAPPEPPRPLHRERGEFSKGVVAAMRRSEPLSPPTPPATPLRRPTFATPPPPAPLPLPLPNTNDTDRVKPAGRPAGDFSGLPPRLRERLERELAKDDNGAPPMRNWLIAVSVLATVGIVLVLMQRFGAIDIPILRGAAGTHAAGAVSDSTEGLLIPDSSAPAAAAAPTDPTTALIDSLRREVESAKQAASLQSSGGGSGTEVAAQPTRPRPAPVRSTSSGAAAAQTVAPGTSSSPAAGEPAFGVGVASYLDESRAAIERERFATETSLPAVVMEYTDAGTTMYRVVIGRWASSNEAERSANSLMERGLINEARVVPLPKR
jgi:hypothetical protein